MYFTEIPADWFHLLRRRGHSDWWQGQLGQKVDSLHYPDILFLLGLLAPKGPCWTCLAAAFATAHSRLRIASCASTNARHILEIMICRGLKGKGQKWVQVSVTCPKLGWCWVLLLKREERLCERYGGKVCFQCVRLAEITITCPSSAHKICMLGWWYWFFFWHLLLK